MSAVSVTCPFAAARTFVFRRYRAWRLHLAPASPLVTGTSAREAARRARKQLKKQRREERLRSFYSWCAGCKAFGSAF